MKTARENIDTLSFRLIALLFTTLCSFSFESFVFARVGVLTCPKTDCQASLVGPRHILTAAHCIAQVDSKAIAQCSFNIPNETNAQSSLSGFSLSGSGGSKEDSLSGKDWKILGLKRDLGNQFGFYRPYEGMVSENLELTMRAFYRNDDGKTYINLKNKCVVEKPPQELIQLCPKSSDGKKICNFFVHHCSAAPSLSGAPFLARIDDQDRLVGIYTGRASTSNEGEEEKSYPIATTLNPTGEANDFFLAWWMAMNFDLLEEISSSFRTRETLPQFSILKSPSDEEKKNLIALISNWSDQKYTFDLKLADLKKYNFWQKQWALYRCLRQIYDQRHQDLIELDLSFFST